MSRKKRVPQKHAKADAKRSEELLPKLAEQIERRRLAGGKPYQTIISPKGMASMSDAIHDLIMPFIVPDMPLEAYNYLSVVAIVAWNAVIVPPDKRPALLQEATDLFLADVSDEDRKLFEELLEALMVRRLELFPHNKRWIIDYIVTDLGDTFHLSIISGLPGDPTFEQQIHSLLPESVLPQRSPWQMLRAWWRSWWPSSR